MRLPGREIDIVAAERKEVIVGNLGKSVTRRSWQAPPFDQGTALALHGNTNCDTSEGSLAETDAAEV